MACHLTFYRRLNDRPMETLTADDSLVHRKKRRKATQIGKKRHWTVWVFFTLTTAIILYQVYYTIAKALTF